MITLFLIGPAGRKSIPPTPSPVKTTLLPKDEKELLAEALKGNQVAYNVLVKRYRKMVFSIAMGITDCREDAEEATQDAFLKAFRYLPTYRGESSFKTWLYRVARTTALDYGRRKRIASVSHDAPGSPAMHIQEPGSNSLQVLMRNERTESIKKAMGMLSTADEAALQLFYFHDQSIEEISSTMGWTTSNTKSRLSRARQRLRAVLGDAFVAETVHV